MPTSRRVLIAAGVFALGGVVSSCSSPMAAIAAGGLLHPTRRHLSINTPAGCTDSRVQGEGVTLAGWRCQAGAARRGTLVYLHGIADNRGSARGVIERYTRRGLDVLAFDSRAHGESTGDSCTYGYFEKADLRRIIDTAALGPIVLFGTSLGAAVAMQEAATDARVRVIVAAEVFSDLRTVARERAPFFLTTGTIERAFRQAERDGHFVIDAVSPVDAASAITVPVLLIHGADDRETRPAHSERVLAALRGPKRLILVPHKAHNQSLSGDVWDAIDEWIERTLERRDDAGSPAAAFHD